MFCPECGKMRQSEMKFCAGCGHKYESETGGTLSAQRTTQQNISIGTISTTPHQSSLNQHTRWQPSNTPATITANSLIIPPPPSLPDLNSPGINQNEALEHNGLSASAAYAGYRLFEPSEDNHAHEAPPDRKTKLITFFSIACVFLLTAGIPLYQYIRINMEGISIKGPVDNEKYSLRVVIPKDWKYVKNPQKKTGYKDTIGYYFKGRASEPYVLSVIYYGGLAEDVPERFSMEFLEYIEPQLERQNEIYIGSMGLEYELLELKFFMINDRHAIWMDGNIKGGGFKTRRDFTFIAFGDTRQYAIKFLFEEENVEDLWPEIKDILESIEFY